MSDECKHYRVFTRTWWRINPKWPDGREPCAGRQHTLVKGLSYDEARRMCQAWNATHKPGRLSRKAEFTSD
jgi:hypothetical protein